MSTNRILAAGVFAIFAALVWPLAFDRPRAFGAESSERVGQQESTAESNGQDILASDIEVSQDGRLRAWIGVDTGGVISIVIKNSAGTVLDVLSLNNGTAITADTGQVFDWAARAGRKYNYRTDTSADVTLYVDLLVK